MWLICFVVPKPVKANVFALQMQSPKRMVHQLFSKPCLLRGKASQLGPRAAEPHWVLHYQTSQHLEVVHALMDLVALEVLQQVGVPLRNPGWQ